MNKPKDDVNNENFQDCNPKLKSDLYDVVDAHHEMFQEPTGLPPKREIQHEIHLQQDFPLPNIGMYHMSIMENVEINRQIKEIVGYSICILLSPIFTYLSISLHHYYS